MQNGFHMQGGLFFDRKENGDIEVAVYESAVPDAKVLRTFQFPADEFASAIAAVSKRGSSAETHAESINLLQKED